ncbi:DEAD/DEAH box helicase [Spirosoma soli]|uniref:DEAD/DEAH box helicase n=1 Tax=Spirosoma soli TaxID=1770529 RepID=A0ABW5LZF1_9BACT
MLDQPVSEDNPNAWHVYHFEKDTIVTLTDNFLVKHSSEVASLSTRAVDVQPLEISINEGTFTQASRLSHYPTVVVRQERQAMWVACTCGAQTDNLCDHQAQVLWTIVNRRELRVFFDQPLRYEAIKTVAKDYGLENELQLDDFFELTYGNRSITIQPIRKELLPITPITTAQLIDQLVPNAAAESLKVVSHTGVTQPIIVFTKHRYYDNFCIQLFEAAATRDGKIKNPLVILNPLDFAYKSNNLDEVKFFTGITRFQNHHRTKQAETDIEGLKLVVRNPLQLQAFYHNAKASEAITANSLVPVKLPNTPVELRLSVHQADTLYQVSAKLLIGDKPYEVENVSLKYDYFIAVDDLLVLINDADYWRAIQFFTQKNNSLLIHQTKYEEFRHAILAKLENRIAVNYSYLKPATPSQLAENGFNDARERLVYLSDTENYVYLSPVMKYGPVEVPVLSKRQIYSIDRAGNPFMVQRDEQAELEFTLTIVNQHPDFQEQLDQPHFMLHKEQFLDEGWFLDAFDTWQSQHIQVLGFNKLTKNKLNGHKAKVSVKVDRGLDWFETSIGISFGKQKVSLKHLQKALKNRSRYVTLDDGTLGVLPREWLERFSSYVKAGEVVDEQIRTPNVNFSAIRELYPEEVLADEVKQQLTEYVTKLTDHQSINPVETPPDLRATLRSYQQEGLNWLNFLDDLGFGGCLADDMGLGKTLQIIAFILSQRAKRETNTNLVVVPTSLLFNWQAEVAKFAPSIKLYTLYGAHRQLDRSEWGQYEIILTSYGTLLSDARQLKEYRFNYIFLDESQAIKNPDSQRYQAVRQLRSRNRIVLTGTPIENHTFDLYGQLSFACPGLLGSYQHFKDHYSTPIDRFDDRQRAKELQRKISPFILRRTKEQVAPELPDKTEMILYCEMGPQQRKVYNAYEQEFRQFLLTTKEGDIPRLKMHILQGLTKLRQICNSPALLGDEEYYGDASAKLDTLLEQIQSKSAHHKILVFSQFVSMLDLIRDELHARQIDHEYLTGQTRNREAVVNRFQDDENCRVFLISLKAGGTGLNLTQADYVYIVDPWWNPAVEDQAIDRSYRIGQTNHVMAIRMICPDTIEEKILELQSVKKKLATTLIQTDESMLKSLSMKDLLALLT